MGAARARPQPLISSKAITSGRVNEGTGFFRFRRLLGAGEINEDELRRYVDWCTRTAALAARPGAGDDATG